MRVQVPLFSRCPACHCDYQKDDSADGPCKRCSEESVDKVLAPFEAQWNWQLQADATDSKHAHDVVKSARAYAEVMTHDPRWAALRRVARLKWPSLEDADDVGIAIRVRKWLDEHQVIIHEKITDPELQRHLVPLDAVIKRLVDTQKDPADGPVAGGFRYRGIAKTGLTGMAWKLVDYLWGCGEDGASFDDVAEHVWGDSQRDGNEVKGKFRSPRSVANCFFKDNALPFMVSAVPKPYLKRFPDPE